jgi:threonine/homoserine/homoserine lactone efflux protein
MSELLALLAFAFVGTVSPGPNNAVLSASGLRFGFARTAPYVLGTALGMAVLLVGVAAGLGALIEAVPALELGLKIVGSAYLLFVAYRILGSGGLGRASVEAPPTLWQGLTFQCVNPKAWLFVLAAVGTFLRADLPRLLAVGVLTGAIAVVVLISSSIWAFGGAALGRLVQDARRRRAVNAALAALLVASVALIWR